MGYYVELEDSNITLKNADKNTILQVWKDLNHPSNNHLKTGGSYSGGKQTGWHYAWLAEDYDECVENVEEMLEMLGFSFEEQGNGDILITGYDSKTGNENVFFKAAAPYIQEGQYGEWRGEDKRRWAWYFDGTQMHEISIGEARKSSQAVQEKKATSVRDVTRKNKSRRYNV